MAVLRLGGRIPQSPSLHQSMRGRFRLLPPARRGSDSPPRTSVRHSKSSSTYSSLAAPTSHRSSSRCGLRPAAGSSFSRSSMSLSSAVTILDRILLTLIIAELVYTPRFVLRTHEIAAEPFLFIGLIAVVRRILIVTAQFERAPVAGRALTNLLLELGLLGFLALALAIALALIHRYRTGTVAPLPNTNDRPPTNGNQ